MTEQEKKYYKIGRKIIVNDKMQTGYSYLLSEPIGKNFNADFNPELNPSQMLELGVFGGKYMTDCQEEFPKSWYQSAKLSPNKKNPKMNFFQVNASQPLSVWVQKGWIHHDDPRGWFQWYCRYYLGRRHEDDTRQIKRWKAITRHIMQLRKNCRAGDWTCRPRQRQAILHWAYDSRKF